MAEQTQRSSLEELAGKIGGTAAGVVAQVAEKVPGRGMAGLDPTIRSVKEAMQGPRRRARRR